MEYSSSSSSSPLSPNDDQKKSGNGVKVFHASLLKQGDVPKEFEWSSGDLAGPTAVEELNEPLIDLGAMMSGDEGAAAAAAQVREACEKHGFFQVTNHGVEQALIQAAYDEVDSIFGMPMEKKLSAWRKHGEVFGYSGAHADRYKSKLLWKEVFSFEYSNEGSETQVVEHFRDLFGHELEGTGKVYERMCKAMKELGGVIMELIAISLGINRSHFREYFKDGGGIMRCNLYPPCSSSNLTMGTGPHSDPTSITILHQDQVGGLEVFIDGKWLAVRPRPDAFVINLGDTFQALTNGRYKSCLHRALVHSEKERKSLVYFVAPRKDKTVKPPPDFMLHEQQRLYPDFTWSDLYNFVQLHYRPDLATLPNFISWFQSQNHH